VILFYYICFIFCWFIILVVLLVDYLDLVHLFVDLLYYFGVFFFVDLFYYPECIRLKVSKYFD